LFVRALVTISVVMAVRPAMRADAVESRTYLLGVAVSLTTAWVAINIAASVIRANSCGCR
jgi:hypothetical protein